MNLIALAPVEPLAHDFIEGARQNLLFLNPRYIVSVLGTSADPTSGETRATIKLANGEVHHVVNSALNVASMLEEAARHG